MTISGWSIDYHTLIQQMLAERIDIVDLVSEMSKVATTGVYLRIPVIGKLYLRFMVIRRRQKHQSKPALLTLMPAHFFQSKFGAIKIQRVFQVADPDHGMQVTHFLIPLENFSAETGKNPEFQNKGQILLRRDGSGNCSGVSVVSQFDFRWHLEENCVLN